MARSSRARPGLSYPSAMFHPAAPLATCVLDSGEVLLAGASPLVEDAVLLALAGPDGAEPIWTSADPAAAPCDLLSDGQGGALLLVPGEILLHVDAGQEVIEAEGEVPLRIAMTDGRLLALMDAGGGATRVVETRPALRDFGAPGRKGPDLLPGQQAGPMLTDAEGRVLLFLNDPQRGFHLWREEAGEWHLLTGDGASRYGTNAAVSDALIWGGVPVWACGPDNGVRAAIPGLHIAGDLMALGPDDLPVLLAGELRTSPARLLVPRIGPGSLLGQARSIPLQLALDGADLLVLTAEPAGATALHRVTPGLQAQVIATSDLPLRLARLDGGALLLDGTAAPAEGEVDSAA